MEPISIEKFYTGFYVIDKLKEEETERYSIFLGKTLKTMGFLSLDVAYDNYFINDTHKERIKNSGIKILSNAKVITGYCLMGIIIERLENDKPLTDEIREVVKAWMESYISAEGKDKKSYDIFVDMLNSFLNKDLTEAQLKFLTNVVELGKTDLKGVEKDIIDDAQRRLAQKTPLLDVPYSKNRHARAIINLSLRQGLFSNPIRDAINTFNAMATRAMNMVEGMTRIFR